MESPFEFLLSLSIGVGLSAACGFRVFVPLLVMSIASLAGHIDLAADFEWIGTYPALIAFATATTLEIAGYYIPWLDNLLDSIAGPTAIAAGVIVTASLVADVSPFLRWTVAVLAGGGAAGSVQLVTTFLRAGSTGFTGGIGNPLVSTLEFGGSMVVSILAIVVPMIAIMLVLLVVFFAWRTFQRGRSLRGIGPASGTPTK